MWQYRLMTGIRAGSGHQNRCMIMGWHCAHTQMQKVGLAVGGMAVLDPKLSTVVLVGGLWLEWGQGGTQGAGVCECKNQWCFHNESFRESVAVVIAIGFLSGKSCWGPLWSCLLGSVMGSSGMKAVSPQHPQMLLRFSAVKAVGVLCRAGHWALCCSHQVAHTGSSCPLFCY